MTSFSYVLTKKTPIGDNWKMEWFVDPGVATLTASHFPIVFFFGLEQLHYIVRLKKTESGPSCKCTFLWKMTNALYN